MEFSIAINAGGQSARMGTNKAFVEVNGQPMIERIIERVASLGQTETFLVTNTPADYEHLGLRMVGDVVPDSGSLGGIYAALYHSTTDYVLVLACDMPFINREILAEMLKFVDGENEVVVPRVDDFPQGLHALYHRNCLAPIQTRIEAKRLKVIGFYQDVQVHYLDENDYQQLDPDGLAFMNVNTPAELAEANRLALELDS